MITLSVIALSGFHCIIFRKRLNQNQRWLMIFFRLVSYQKVPSVADLVILILAASTTEWQKPLTGFHTLLTSRSVTEKMDTWKKLIRRDNWFDILLDHLWIGYFSRINNLKYFFFHSQKQHNYLIYHCFIFSKCKMASEFWHEKKLWLEIVHWKSNRSCIYYTV